MSGGAGEMGALPASLCKTRIFYVCNAALRDRAHSVGGFDYVFALCLAAKADKSAAPQRLAALARQEQVQFVGLLSTRLTT